MIAPIHMRSVLLRHWSSPFIIFFVAATALAHELLVSRLFIFLLGEVSAFFAIPLTLLGVSIGAYANSLAPQRYSLSQSLRFTFYATIAAYAGAMWTFNEWLGMINFAEQNPLMKPP